MVRQSVVYVLFAILSLVSSHSLLWTLGKVNIGYVLLTHKDVSRAREILESVPVNAPQGAFALGQLYRIIGQTERSLEVFNWAGKQRYHADLAFFWAGEAAWRLGDRRQGVKLWTKAAQHNPGLPSWLLSNFSWTEGIGWAQDVTGIRKFRAYEALVARLARASIESGYRDVWLYHIVGSYYDSINDVDRAVMWYTRGDKEARSGPLWVPATDLAGLYMKLGKYAIARQWWWRAIERCPNPRPDYVLQIARTYEAEGRTDEALKYYSQAVIMAPGNQEYRRQLEQFLKRTQRKR